MKWKKPEPEQPFPIDSGVFAAAAKNDNLS